MERAIRRQKILKTNLDASDYEIFKNESDMYSASADEIDTVCCFFEDQEMRLSLWYTTRPLVLFRSLLSPPQSASDARGTGRRLCRGQRTRGGSARHAIDLSSSSPAFVLHNIKDLPRGQSLETLLTPRKKKRTYSSTSAAPKTEALTPNVNASLDAEETILGDLYTSTAPEAEAPMMPSTSASSDRPAESLLAFYTPPPPTVILKVFENNGWTTQKTSPRDTKTDKQFLGSESEDSDSGDDDESRLPSYAVRGLMALEDTPLEFPEILPFKTEPVKEPEMAYRPSDLYDFEWRKYPDPPIPPESRREKFSQKSVGPKIKYKTPYDAFVAIWDLNIMEHIAEQTNLYAQQLATHKMETNDLHPASRIASWTDVTVDELYVYFGILLAMGVVIKSKMPEYWDRNRTIFETPGFSAYMKLKRFQLLNKCIHFNNNEVMCAQSLDISAAKLFKIQPLLTHLNQKFQNLYNLSQNLAVDESLLQWKGWLDINQFISNKIATVGIKAYEVCESQTGYLWRFEVHTYKTHLPQQRSDPLQASTPAIVLKLLEGLEYRGHTVWLDNFYNSPALARKLKTLGFDCVGTLRTNCQFVPEVLTKLTIAGMQPGPVSGCTSGDVDLVVWKDRNRMISTYHGNTTTTTADGKCKPIVIQDYNVMMGGVDKKDQMLAVYPIERKSCRVWYKKLFRRLLNISVLNSYILYRQSVLPKRYTHRDFRISLINCILSTHQTTAPLPRSVQVKAVILVKDNHLAQLGCDPGTNRHQRMKCIVCKKRVSLYCVGCQKTFCMHPCFVDAHESPKILHEVMAMK